ncbi:hypothetical protein [Herpetosiphon giganteus]|uniref:hypothetical protein n=1 Tax=Herpetosiphon giganteus TaxID=2029754 RepID=UPI0019566E4B|nr:hypothetical protein [Herpetosiphon giganteus]MBM7843042.1 hypothetical protein [Herpetosiphon giganteus]
MLRSNIFMRWLLALVVLISISACGELAKPQLAVTSMGSGFLVVDADTQAPITNAKLYIDPLETHIDDIHVMVNKGESVAHARVYLQPFFSSSDNKGFVASTIKMGTNFILITAPGYEPTEILIMADP